MEILVTEKSIDYELVDSGGGEKLERYGIYFLRRPDPQAIWQKTLDESEWQRASAVFTRTSTTGKWVVAASSQQLVARENTWKVSLQDFSFTLKLLPSKHLGVFPEQSVNWKWLEEKIQHDTNIRIKTNDTNKIQVLNLFAHTGGATMACARAGASVCHVDASQFAVDFAHDNLKNSGLGEKPVRFIVDDVRKFVEREIKRGKKYDIILLDPPVYGKGSKGEVWKIEEDLLPLLTRLKSVLSDSPVAIILNGYASEYSSTTYAQILSSITGDLKGNISNGELAIRESSAGRLLPCGIFARWEN